MAQNHDTVADSSCMISDEDCNGLRICKRDIAIELLTTIFCYLDHRTLLNCQLVCKRWKMIIQDYVWWKKAGLVLNKLLSREELSWQVFYLIYKTKPPFERKNLVAFRDFKIHSGSEQSNTKKIELINVVSEGFDPYILDVLQPPIMISEWYSCQNNFRAVYDCKIELLDCPKECSLSHILDTFQFTDVIEGERVGKWHYMSHVFTNYGRGLRWIRFMYYGTYYLAIKEPTYLGCKMAGACVRIMSP